MHKPIIIKITGGLGNQLFQYAYGRRLELVEKKNVVFNTSFFKTNRTDTPRPFLLNNFNINPNATFAEVPTNIFTTYAKKIRSKLTGDYGFYQSEKYFAPIKDVIAEEFTLIKKLSPQAENISNNIKLQSMPVSLHIRRGDYANDEKTRKHHGLCSLDYYQEAVDCIKGKVKNPLFFVFSDDIAWAKQNLQLDNAVFVSNPEIRDYEELILMSQCTHNIIANSTFSWWAAYLNKNAEKIVIAPKQWNVKNASDTLDILPPSWIQL